MSWRITASYAPPFPETPSHLDEWTDINTGIPWVFLGSSFEAEVYELDVYADSAWVPQVSN
jgi:hypothetical protein